MRETITVSLPEELKNDLDEVAREEGLTRSDLVRASLRDFLVIRKYRLLRLRLVARARAKGLVADEDVFEKIS